MIWGTGVSRSINGVGGSIFSPSTLSPLAWYDPSYTAGLWKDTAGTSPVTADGDAVARIDDRSGNGRHMLQSTLANRPLWKTSGGLSWLEFDGSNDLMIASDATITLPSSHEITAAATATQSAGVTSALLSLADTSMASGNADLELGTYNASGTYRVRSRYLGGVDTFSTGPTLTSPFVIAQSRESSTALNQYRSGVKVGSTITTATTIGASKYLRIGQHTSAAQYMSGKLYGLIVTSALSAGDRASLRRGLGPRPD